MRTKVRLSLYIISMLCFNTVWGQTGEQTCNLLRNNVLQITATFSDGNDENGFGFVVGEKANTLYVVTAKHIVFHPSPEIATNSIVVKLYYDKGNRYKAKLLDLSYGELDLCLLELPKPPDYKWKTEYIDGDCNRGDNVWYIGRSGEWFVPAAFGKINSKMLKKSIHS